MRRSLNRPVTALFMLMSVDGSGFARQMRVFQPELQNK